MAAALSQRIQDAVLAVQAPGTDAKVRSVASQVLVTFQLSDASWEVRSSMSACVPMTKPVVQAGGRC